MREVRELRQANAILRDTAVFFARELDPRGDIPPEEFEAVYYAGLEEPHHPVLPPA